MAVTDRLIPAHRAAVEMAIRQAERACRFEISLYLGHVGEIAPRDLAERMHGALSTPSQSILLLVDPETRALEIVTGAAVRPHLTDQECVDIIRTIITTLADSNLIVAVTQGIALIGARAARNRG